MLRIGIDVRLLIHRRGMGTYVYNLLAALAGLPGDEQYVLYVDDERATELTPRNPRFTVRKIGPKFYPLWEQIGLPLSVARDRLDVLHCPASTAPLFLPSKIKLVLTLHDAACFLPKSVLPRSSSLYQRTGRLYFRLFGQHGANKAAWVITDSENSRRDILRTFHVPQEKIRVIYPAGNAACRRLENQSIVDQVKQRCAIKGRYIFTLGALDPRKNTLGVLQAFARFRKVSGLPLQLVIAGLSNDAIIAGLTPDAKIRFNALVSGMGLQGQVTLLGFVSEEELVALYNGADAFVYPSFYEGFGLPVLEAMACGAPVVTSPCGSIPEVAGEAALMVDPLNVDEIANGILRAVTDDALRQSLIIRGQKQARKFTWQRTALQMLEIYRNVAV